MIRILLSAHVFNNTRIIGNKTLDIKKTAFLPVQQNLIEKYSLITRPKILECLICQINHKMYLQEMIMNQKTACDRLPCAIIFVGVQPIQKNRRIVC